MTERISATLPPIPQVEALIDAMTVEEKAGQLTQRGLNPNDDIDQILKSVKLGEIGSFLNAQSLDQRNRLQHAAIEETRLGIPIIFGRDVIHGYRTIFPIPLGLAATFNPDLVQAASAIAAREAMQEGVDWTFAPMLDVSRDPRWGRVAEGCGEDPYLTACMGTRMVRGFQQSVGEQRSQFAACAKHFVGYGAVEAGKDYNTTWIPEQLLRDVYLAPFKACVEEGVLTVMSAFNDINGTPASGNERTLREILKNEWGFTGFVVSDWEAIIEMITHGVCRDSDEAAIVALRAGIDLDMASRAYLQRLPRLVQTNVISMSLLDESVRRILTVKHRLGLFKHPYVEPAKVSVLLCEDHRTCARQAAAQSIVLLKNESDCLPLPKNLKSLALVGPLADAPADQLGCWVFDSRAEDSVTILKAIRERVDGSIQLNYVAGLTECRSADTSGFQAAIEAAEQSEVTIVVVGESADLSGEARSRAFLNLPGKQQQLVEALAATGKPLIVLVLAGRPLIIGDICPLAQAVLYGWHPGTMAGPAICDLLWGDVAPSGKLPMSIPRAVGQIPIYYANRMTGRPPKRDFKGIPTGTPLDPVDMDASYLDVEVSPQFRFGFGLTYTSFKFDEIQVNPRRAPLGANISVTARVTNSGAQSATAVAQLYVHDKIASLTRPVRELKGFSRLTLDPAESRVVTFTLPSEALAFCRKDGKVSAEPGEYQVFVGEDSGAGLTQTFELYAT
jgi:beta-glucosidase